jgi:hypothetical protein
MICPPQLSLGGLFSSRQISAQNYRDAVL